MKTCWLLTYKSGNSLWSSLIQSLEALWEAHGLQRPLSWPGHSPIRGHLFIFRPQATRSLGDVVASSMYRYQSPSNRPPQGTTGLLEPLGAFQFGPLNSRPLQAGFT